MNPLYPRAHCARCPIQIWICCLTIFLYTYFYISKYLDVRSDWGAEVGLLHDLLQPVHTVLGVGEHVLVDGLHALVVVLQGRLDLVLGVLNVLQAPGLGVALQQEEIIIISIIFLFGLVNIKIPMDDPENWALRQTNVISDTPKNLVSDKRHVRQTK